MTNALKFTLTLILITLISAGASAQEICDNGIDDDGDGLVDLRDTTDCACNIEPSVESVFPNPSFEGFAPDEEGCTSQQNGGLPDGAGQVDCLVGWIRASDGTTDSWNAFTYSGNPPFWPSAIPQPLPSGSGVAGFWSGVMRPDDFDRAGNQLSFLREYLGACLKDGGGLTPGENYRLTLNIGFAEESFFASGPEPVAPSDSARISSPPVAPLALYGIRSCATIRFEGNDCVENSFDAVGWEKIKDFDVNGVAGSWSAATVDFTPTAAYEAIAIGASCEDNLIEDRPEWRHYYFVDDVRINTEEAFVSAGFVPGPVSVQGESICDDNIVLTGSEAAGGTFQWFKDGVAIVGATNRDYRIIPGLDIDGDYQLRTTVATGCAISDPVTIQRPVIPESIIRDSFVLCSRNDGVSISATSNFAAEYEWTDGSTERFFTVFEPGDYAVTISTACEIKVEEYTVVLNGEPTFQVEVADQACFVPGQSATFIVTTNWDIPFLTVTSIADDGSESMVDFFRAGQITIGPLTSSRLRFETVFFCEQPVEVIVDLEDLNPFFDEELPTLNCRAADGTIALTPRFEEDLTYQWLDPEGDTIVGATNLELTVSEAGTYTLLTLSAAGCDGAVTFDVVEDEENITYEAALPTLSCTVPNGTIQVTTTDPTPVTYRWFGPTGQVIPGETGLDLPVGEPGSYQLEASYGNSCVQVETFTVAFDDIQVDFTATIPNVSCLRPEAELNVATTFAPPLTYRWEGPDGEEIPGATNLDLTVSEAGTYTLIYTFEGGCVQRTGFEINFVEERIAYTASVPELTCAANTGNLIVSTGFGGPVTYQWLDPSGEPIPAANSLTLPVSAGGAYTLITIISPGCEQRETFTVPFTETPVEFEAMIPSLSCLLQTGQLVTESPFSADLSFQWLDENGNPIPGGTSANLPVDEPGDYTLTYRFMGGCEGQTTFTVPFEENITAEIDVTSSFCEDLHSLSAGIDNSQGNIDFAWSDSTGRVISRNEEIAGLSSGAYQLLVSNGALCSATAAVVIDTVIGLRLDSVTALAECDAEGGTLATSVSGGIGPYTYALAGGMGGLDSDVPAPAEGTYVVEVTDANGCLVTSGPVTLRRPVDFEIEVGEDRIIKLGDPLEIRTLITRSPDQIPGLRLSWASTGDTLSCRDCLNPTAIPTRRATYTLTAVSSEGCLRTDTLSIEIDTRVPAFFPTAFSPNADGVNDTYEVFPSAGYAGIEYLRIYNRWGALVYEASPEAPSWDGKINGELAGIGAYTFISGLHRLDGRLIQFEGVVSLLR